MRLGAQSALQSDISSLVQLADTLFINAQAMLHYICNPNGSPLHRLRAVVEKLASVQDLKEQLARGSPSCLQLPASQEREFHKLEFAKLLKELPTYLAMMDALQQVCAAGESILIIDSYFILVAR
jgi:hypothetical protein